MSTISNRHSVLPFVSGKSEPLSGQRLAKIGYKPRGTNAAKFASVCVSVPFFPEPLTESQLQCLMPSIREMIQNAQDGIIRSLYESSGGTLKSVGDEDISIESVIGYLEAESTGGRLTKEYLNSWFDSNVKDNLTVVICEKLGMEDIEDPRVEKSVAIYKELISSLSGGATILQPTQIKGVRRALDVSSVDDDTSKKLIARLDKMEKAPKIEDLLEL